MGMGELWTRQPHTIGTHSREEGRSNTPTSWCQRVPTTSISATSKTKTHYKKEMDTLPDFKCFVPTSSQLMETPLRTVLLGLLVGGLLVLELLGLFVGWLIGWWPFGLWVGLVGWVGGVYVCVHMCCSMLCSVGWGVCVGVAFTHVVWCCCMVRLCVTIYVQPLQGALGGGGGEAISFYPRMTL